MAVSGRIAHCVDCGTRCSGDADRCRACYNGHSRAVPMPTVGPPAPVEIIDGDWQAHAACQGTGPEVFFPERGQQYSTVRIAKAICARCPVRAQCLNFAVETGQKYGIFGGLTERERRKHRRARLRRAS